MRLGTRRGLLAVAAVWAGLLVGHSAHGGTLGNEFTYQGRLKQTGAPVTGDYDLEFRLYDDPDAGTQVGPTETLTDHPVTNGLFTAPLDFGADAFDGDARWLQIVVEGNTLTPRQKLTAAPYALFALGAPWSGLRGIPAGFDDGTDDVGWALTGNAGTDPATDFLGTLDNQPLVLRVNNIPALRLEPGAGGTPHVIGGYEGNSVATGAEGATIGGGGAWDPEGPGMANVVYDSYGTIGGGGGNQAGNDDGDTTSAHYATVAGGQLNTASDNCATVGGGSLNSGTGLYATVGGGFWNRAAGHWATVGGGSNNHADHQDATVAGGGYNSASGMDATVGGGSYNTASGSYATVPGGFLDTASGDYSFAAGRRAKANHHGAFVWADSTDADFASTADNQFLIRASGGVGIGTTNPAAQLHVAGDARVTGRLYDSAGSGGTNGQVLTSIPTGTAWATATVDWASVTNIPPDIADGDNDTTYTNGDGLSLIGTEFSVNFGGSGSALTVARSDHTHDVQWADLLGIPLDIADGDDDTTYTNGTGLTLTGTQFALDTAYTDGLYVNEGQPDAIESGMLQDDAVTAAKVAPNIVSSLNGVTHDGDNIDVVAGSGINITPDDTANTITIEATGGVAPFWSLSGNAGTSPPTDFLGTTDPQALYFRVNNIHAMRFEPGLPPNLIGGFFGNTVPEGVRGGTISGGGSMGAAHSVTADFGTVGGGEANEALAGYATVGGGSTNLASSTGATVGGGIVNHATAPSATVGGGASNQATGESATVAGGSTNAAQGSGASIGGGAWNLAAADYGTIAGGGPSDPGDPTSTRNRVYDDYGTIGGGGGNQAGSDDGDAASDSYATVGGGRDNTASGRHASVGGGNTNAASGASAAVAGGSDNHASGGHASVGGGVSNAASNGHTTIGGGWGNAASGYAATVGGGWSNVASGWGATVPGGDLNTAAGDWSFAAGFRAKANHQGAFVWADAIDADFASTADNQFVARATGGVKLWVDTDASGLRLFPEFHPLYGDSVNVVAGYGGNNVAAGVIGATVSGGGASAYGSNSVGGHFGTVGGGGHNVASGVEATVGGGNLNTASERCATVPGGYYNAANGRYSFAAGRGAKANHDGSFVWADFTNPDFLSLRTNQFRVRANGGAGFNVNEGHWVDIWVTGDNVIRTSTLASLSTGGVWRNGSDAARKHHFAPVDTRDVLERVAALPITTWNHKAQDPCIRHMGPMAQDFHAAFGLGGDDKTIGTLDADGVALAAIQGLHDMVREKEAQLADMAARLDHKDGEIAGLQQRLDKLEALVNALSEEHAEVEE